MRFSITGAMGRRSPHSFELLLLMRHEDGDKTTMRKAIIPLGKEEPKRCQREGAASYDGAPLELLKSSSRTATTSALQQQGASPIRVTVQPFRM